VVFSHLAFLFVTIVLSTSDKIVNCKTPKNEIQHLKMFCGEQGRVPANSLYYFWCFAMSIFSGKWNCRYYILLNQFQKFLRSFFQKATRSPILEFCNWLTDDKIEGGQS